VEVGAANKDRGKRKGKKKSQEKGGKKQKIEKRSFQQLRFLKRQKEEGKSVMHVMDDHRGREEQAKRNIRGLQKPNTVRSGEWGRKGGPAQEKIKRENLLPGEGGTTTKEKKITAKTLLVTV